MNIKKNSIFLRIFLTAIFIISAVPGILAVNRSSIFEWGFRTGLQAGPLINMRGGPGYMALKFSLGYQFNRNIFVCVSVGNHLFPDYKLTSNEYPVSLYDDIKLSFLSLPTAFEIRYNITDGLISPYFTAGAGADFNLGGFDSGENTLFYAVAGAGLRVYMSYNTELLFEAAFPFYNMKPGMLMLTFGFVYNMV